MADHEPFSDGWTLKSLFTYFEHKTERTLKQSEEAVDRALMTLHREHDKFEADVAGRFKNTNELRGALDDLGRKMQTKSEAAASLISLTNKIDDGRKTYDAKFDDLNKQIASLNLLIVGNPAIRTLQDQASLNKGIAEGVGLTKADFYRGLSAAVAVLGFIIYLITIIKK